MAKTVAEIKKQMTDSFISNQAVIDSYELTPGKSFEEEFSIVSIESIIFYCMAFGVWLLYSFFDFFKIEIDAAITNYTHPTLVWYATKMKSYQHGDNLMEGTDRYDTNILITAEQMQAKLVIKYAAAIEQSFSNGRYGIRIKVAGESNNQRVKLPDEQRDAAKEFLKRIKAGGVYCELTTDDADYLKLALRVYYNPLVLNSQGQRLDGTDNEPLQKAIEDHLKNLPFNGRFNLTALTDAMQKVEGIADPRILQAQTKYAALPYTDVVDEVIPDAGYLKIYNENDLTIEWIAKNV